MLIPMILMETIGRLKSYKNHLKVWQYHGSSIKILDIWKEHLKQTPSCSDCRCGFPGNSWPDWNRWCKWWWGYSSPDLEW